MEMECYVSNMRMFGFKLIITSAMLKFGICAMECDFHLVGPACNFKNMALKVVSRHNNNVDPPLYSNLANDNNLSTCSYTSDGKTAAPWWNLWLSERTTVKKIEFVTIENRRSHFQNFEVIVFNTSEADFLLRKVSKGTVCYQHNNSIPQEKKIQVTCDGSPVGNLIRIQLHSKEYQLVLCDFRLYEDCKNGFYGNGCERCSDNCYPSEYRNCSSNDGHCLNECKSGWRGSQCNIECKSGTWGRNCKQHCGNCYNSTCDRINGECRTGCSAGYKLSRCTEVCNNGYYGLNCNAPCSKTCFRITGNITCNNVNGTCVNGCTAGFEGSYCNIECKSGTWGRNCEQHCGNCYNSTCDRIYGLCPKGCSAGYKPHKCTEVCDNGYYGINCIHQCSTTCRSGLNALCDNVNGTCLNGCNAGYEGLLCNKGCKNGKWGEDCKNDCGKCLSSPCSKVYGNCTGGCAAGYTETKMCMTKCDDGWYGIKCASKCSAHCNNVCEKETGQCSQCKAGWKGKTCTDECTSGEWGENCQHECGNCKYGVTCNRIDGMCNNGCLPGYKNTNHCEEECEEGTYGDDCSGNCSDTCKGVCNKVNGTCDQCQAGWTGDFCDSAVIQSSSQSTDESSATPGIAGALTVILVVALIGVGAYIFYRRKQPYGRPNEANTLKDLKTDKKDFRIIAPKEEPSSSALYVNTLDITKAREIRPKTPERSYVNHCVDQDINENMYSNTNNANEVHLSEFEANVRSRLANTEFFFKQFQKIPYGMQYASDDATKPVNHGKNRYKSMYAYDHSRVILKKLPDVPGSDYINASNIMNDTGKVAYIAAQGPIAITLGDFWRMIWEQNVRTIVMLTNLTEEGKMKCLQYWPEAGECIQHGNITVCSELEDVFAEFTIRRLKIHQMNKPDRTRTLAHFHFTAWPDKDVPRSTSSLLHFWHQVRKHDRKKLRPWLVHCSAGVGRTGTFVALDILYDIGISGDSVDVFKCVDDLRKQRVNMVQTKGQYKYLHFVVLEALVLPSTPVHLDSFHRIYCDLKMTNPTTGKTSLLMQYETLVNEDRGMIIDDQDVAKYEVANRDENRHKNRFTDILAPSDCRPFLLTKVPGCTDYINAVFIPGYRDKFGYIITQTPLQSTAVDCCRLIYEQDVRVIVTFQEYEKRDVGLYLPEREAAKFGPFTVKFIAEEEMTCYARRNYLLMFKSETHTLTQLIFKHWSPSRPTPPDQTKMLNFLENLDNIRKHTELKPVLVQCLNGAERSGLVVVLMNILEQLNFNSEVSIPLVIRQLKSRRQQLIPNFEQFKFCYDVVLFHIESHTTYANM